MKLLILPPQGKLSSPEYRTRVFLENGSEIEGLYSLQSHPTHPAERRTVTLELYADIADIVEIREPPARPAE